jgi:hypothetical protein
MTIRSAEGRQGGFELQTEGPTPARVWGDHWLRVSEKVLKGLNHQLTNRVASLEAVVGVFQDGDVPDPQMIQALATEVTRLHHLLHLFRAMPAEPFSGSEAVRVQDIVPDVLELHGHHADLHGIPCDVDGDDGAHPLLVRPSALLRCLLVVLESGAGNILRSGSTGALTLSYKGDERHVRISFESPQPSGQLLFTGEGSLVHAVRSALSHAHAHVHASVLPGKTEERIRYDLIFPTLAEARRMERDGRG